MTQKLTVTLSKTSDGLADYMQIMSADFMAVNIVLIAGSIDVVDVRTGVKALSKSQERRLAVMADADAEDRSVRGRTRVQRKK